MPLCMMVNGLLPYIYFPASSPHASLFVTNLWKRGLNNLSIIGYLFPVLCDWAILSLVPPNKAGRNSIHIVPLLPWT